jgi:phosphoribosylanthranilate isomerase
MATQSIHVAGVIDLAKAQLLIDCGVRYLGFPMVLDHHKEDLTTDAAAAIVARKPRELLLDHLSEQSGSHS